MSQETPRYVPSEALRAWMDAEGFVPEDAECWGKAWDHSSGFDFVGFRLYPWDGRGGFTGESYEIIVMKHASGTNPAIGLGTAHSLAEIQRIYDALTPLNYDAHQAWIIQNIKQNAIRPPAGHTIDGR